MLTGSKLQEFLAGHADLIAHIHRLFSEIHGSLPDQRQLFILTDGEARIIHVHSHPEVIVAIRKRGIRPGTSVAEESAGTNAVALALRHREPVIIRGEQHYCRLFRHWFCAVLPINGPDGEPVACIDISSYHESGIHEKLALVRLMAEKAEREVIRKHPVPPSHRTLSKRQSEVIRLRSEGYMNKEIADLLGIRTDTVEDHVKAALQRLGARSVEHAITLALPFLNLQ